jgi:hypothetical protein
VSSQTLFLPLVVVASNGEALLGLLGFPEQSFLGQLRLSDTLCIGHCQT